MLHLLPCCWDNARDEIVDVHLQDVQKGVALTSVVNSGGCRPCPVFELVLRERTYFCFNVVYRHVPCCFRGGAEIRGGLHPSHLKGGRYHQSAGFARRLRPHVAEIPFFSLAAIEPPKTILNIPLGH